MGWGDIGRARDLRALCIPLPHPRVSLATTLVQSAKPAGDIRRRAGGQGLPRETLSYRKTRTRGRSYLHNIQTNTSTRGRKKYKQEEEGGRVLRTKLGIVGRFWSSCYRFKSRGTLKGGGGQVDGRAGRWTEVWTSWEAVSVTGAWAFLRPPSPSPPPRRRKGRGRSNRSGAPARGGRHSEDRGGDCPQVQGPYGGCRGTTLHQPKTLEPFFFFFFKQKNAGKGNLFDFQGYCRTGCSNMLVAMETDLH